MIEVLGSVYSVWRGIEGHPLLRAVRTGAEVGQVVGTYLGVRTAAQIEEKGAASGPVFSQEMFDYEIAAIRMGAQI